MDPHPLSPGVLDSQASLGAVILSGGRSMRMGTSKALLPWGRGTLIERMAQIARTVAREVLVVASPDQSLPTLADVEVVRDASPFPGPRAGFYLGLQALSPAREIVLLLGCDQPLWRSHLVKELLAVLETADFAMPVVGEHPQPLGGLYRRKPTLVALANSQKCTAGILSLRKELNGRFLSEEKVRQVDPDLHSFAPCNTPQEWEALQKWANC